MNSSVKILIFGLILATTTAVPVAKKVFGNGIHDSVTFKEREKFSIEDWEAPAEIAEKFPYYLSGYDHEDRPIGVIELGKWDVRSVAKKGGEDWTNLERHAQKMLYILESGIYNKNITENNVTKLVNDELVLIVDWEGFQLIQMTSPKALQFVMKYLGQLERLQDRISYAYFVNVNAVAGTAVRLLKPTLGRAFERVEVYGSKASTWLPVLRRELPLDQIPEKYGGNPGHKPLKMFG